MTKNKTILILGAGFAGCTTAYLLNKEGFDVTILDKEKLPGGGCRTRWYGGHPYTLGPRIFFTRDEEIIKLMTSFLEINQSQNKTWSYIEKDKQFYHYPIYALDIPRMPDKDEINSQLEERKGKTPRVDNFENYWIDAIGSNLYYKFIDKYSKKMWNIDSNQKLSADFKWVNRGVPIREQDTRLYGDMFQGYPSASDGYNQFFEKALKGCKFISECKVESFKDRKVKTNKGDFTGDVIVNTLSVDTLFNNQFGELKYSGRKLLKIVLPLENVLPKDIMWIHYSGDESFTRVTEFNKITDHKSKDTLIIVETPSKQGKHYPVQIKEERERFLKYEKLFPKDFYSIGRLGSFSYKGIPDVMRDAINTTKIICQ